MNEHKTHLEMERGRVMRLAIVRDAVCMYALLRTADRFIRARP